VAEGLAAQYLRQDEMDSLPTLAMNRAAELPGMWHIKENEQRLEKVLENYPTRITTF
jgi:hypothetical protein